jgi:hypothetical protein
MLFPQRLVDGIRDGTIVVAFRSWKRPTVRAGGTLLTAAGQLAIDEVAEISADDIDGDDVVAAGAADRDEILRALDRSPDRRLYRIRFHRLGDDPRVALRSSTDVGEGIDDVVARLDRWDRAAADGPWTSAVLELVAARPAVVSTELAAALGMDRAIFKRRVRQLKSLGLTESLEVGYRVSPRGEVVRRARG